MNRRTFLKNAVLALGAGGVVGVALGGVDPRFAGLEPWQAQVLGVVRRKEQAIFQLPLRSGKTFLIQLLHREGLVPPDMTVHEIASGIVIERKGANPFNHTQYGVSIGDLLGGRPAKVRYRSSS